MRFLVKVLTINAMGSFMLSVPDLSGCQYQCSDIEDGLKEIEAMATQHVNLLIEYNEPVPHPTSLNTLLMQSGGENCAWLPIELDALAMFGKSQKINVTLPERLIKRIDMVVSKTEKYKTRSGFLAQAALNELQQKK